jgi:hypothetical protein
MSPTEKSKVWLTYDHAPTRWIIVGSMVTAWFLASLFLYSDVVAILSKRPWWEDLIVALATVAVPVLAALELRHSAEAIKLRGEANDERRKANELREDANELRKANAYLTAQLDAERNKQLTRIATNTARPITPAERNAETLRRHMGACVSVTEGQGSWPSTPLIAEVSDANIVMLFTPSTGSNPQATCITVDCGELDIVEVPHGSCPLRLHVRRRYGSSVPLGQITRWEDRNLPQAEPSFTKDVNVYHARFSKPGSSETRTLYIYASADGSNSFLLETSAGDSVIGDNLEISKRSMLLEISYRAAGLNRSESGTSSSLYPIFIW